MTLPKAVLLAGILGLIINLIILYLARPLAPGFMPLSVAPVCMWTILGTIGACITYALVRKWSAHPSRTFLIIAIIVLLLSFIPDYLTLHASNGAFKGATPAGAAVLMLMHVVVAALTVGLFLRIRRPEGPTFGIKPIG
ncbi:MAG TPA: DUF6069 family protein [Steroidobacteraceae bacterium]|nr:DUF6069 family protein [Steroidobacteraceae bacterium]